MADDQSRVCIVVLNWNGWQDTIACLESIERLDCPGVCTIVVDNHSTDDSVPQIVRWAAQRAGTRNFLTIRYRRDSDNLDYAAAMLRPGTSMLIQSDENLGFAAGSNLGIRMAMQARIDYVWLLNNDAVAEPQALTKLVSFLDSHSEFAGVTGQIRYHTQTDTIWNCGGVLLPLGLRKYHFRNAAVSRVPERGYRPISFMTGCAALLRADALGRVGPLSEDFFFGEEDFELCQRLKRRGARLACCYDAIIYHKVGTSISKASHNNSPAKAYLYYLNRFVHMRRYWGRTAWTFWRHGYCLYLLFLLMKQYGMTLGQSISLVRRLLVDSSRLRRVDRATFQNALKRDQAERSHKIAGAV